MSHWMINMVALHCGMHLMGGWVEVIEAFIASGRDLGDIENKKGKYSWDYKYYTALEIARKFEKREVVSLLERFMTNPTQTRHEVREI